MKRFALSLLATKQSPSSVFNQHDPVVVEAVNHDAAVGRGYTIVRETRPPSEGWGHYHVCAVEIDDTRQGNG